MITIAYIIFLLTIIFIFILDRIKYKRLWFDPLYCFLFIMFIYISPLSWRYIYKLPIKGNVTPYFWDIAEIFPYSLILTTIAVIIFYIAYLFSPTIKFKSKFINTDKHNPFILSSISILVFLGGLSALFLFSQKFGGVSNLIHMGYSVTTVLAQQPIISLSINMVISASFLMMTTYSILRKKRYFALSILMFLLPFVLYLILSRRAELIVWTGAYVIFYSLSVKPIRFKIILPAILIGFITLNVLGTIRHGDKLTLYYTHKNYTYIVDDFLNRHHIITQPNNQKQIAYIKMFYTLTEGQFAVPYETLPILMKYNNEPLRYGSTLTDIVVQWIPRAIYPEKDYGIAVWYYHEFYDKYAPPNVGRTFFFLSEGYLNFGVIGIFIWAALWGLFWKNIAYLSKYNNFLFYFIFSIYTSSMIILINNYSVGLFVSIIKTYILWFLLPYLFYLTLIHIKNKKECIK